MRRLPLGRGRKAGPPPGRPPCPNERRADGRSSAPFTRSERPSSSRPFSCSMAAAASLGVESSTNAKPRARPLSRSVGIDTSSTSPIGAKSSRICSSRVSKLRLPTKTLNEMASFFLCARRLPARGAGIPSPGSSAGRASAMRSRERAPPRRPSGGSRRCTRSSPCRASRSAGTPADPRRNGSRGTRCRGDAPRARLAWGALNQRADLSFGLLRHSGARGGTLIDPRGVCVDQRYHVAPPIAGGRPKGDVITATAGAASAARRARSGRNPGRRGRR